MGASTETLGAFTFGCAVAALLGNGAALLSGFELRALTLTVNVACALAALALSLRAWPQEPPTTNQGEDQQ